MLDGPFDAHGSELFAAGAISPSRAPRCSSRAVLEPAARASGVLDLCAAPGRQDDASRGADRRTGARSSRSSATRAGRRRSSAPSRGCTPVASVWSIGDAARTAHATAPFDRVLVDPPCSGLGTLQSRPDLRWRARPEAIAELAALQARILDAGAAATAPGGTLVYSVCTISRAEGQDVIEAFLREHPDSARRIGGVGPRRSGRTVVPVQLLPAPRRHRRLLHRPAAPAIERRPRYPPRTVTEPATKLGPECPGCGEPWLRADRGARPLPLRLLPAALRARLGVSRTAASTRRSCGCRAPRSSPATTARAACSGRSRCRRPIARNAALLREPPDRPVDPVGGLRAASASRSPRSWRPARG